MKRCDFAKCVIEDCSEYALFGADRCPICCGAYCYDHVDDPSNHICHTNPPSDYLFPYKSVVEDEIAEILEVLNFDAIVAEVEALRPGHRCIHVDRPENASHMEKLTGAYNFHLIIEYDDGLKWVMRIRRKQTSLQPEGALMMSHESEIATLKALYTAGIRVPRAYARPQDSKVSSHLLYFYQEFIEGLPTSVVLFNPACTETLRLAGEALIRNYAAWMIDLEKVTFDKVGSLFLTDIGTIHVGPHVERDRTILLDHPYLIGPYDTAKERWIAAIECRMKLILDKKEVSPSNELHAYLVMLEMRELVKGCPELDEEFKVDRDTGELNGIIDWDWASLTCKAEAYAAPEYFRLEHSKMYSSQPTTKERYLIQAYEDLGRCDLANFVRRGRKYHWLHNTIFWLQWDVKEMNAARRAFLALPDVIEGEPQTNEDWREIMLRKFDGDAGLMVLKAQKRLNCHEPPRLDQPVC
ncbi:hypothetical protein L486_04173 [Kwoniella mangroviensis CBS 10435]|uniref:Aminoglycoside phosphotransferase domain-containing protein n=1 Tax=Kwoniella mangroviensis CBS 10435 TaxID=1331196 RepID=A0A1B9IRH2_9TREE|nr:hypothetical protein L486_04173 [Kwoniella mangroviensis CBS 10435]